VKGISVGAENLRPFARKEHVLLLYSCAKITLGSSGAVGNPRDESRDMPGCSSSVTSVGSVRNCRRHELYQCLIM
jgi:hypothetical protein